MQHEIKIEIKATKRKLKKEYKSCIRELEKELEQKQELIEELEQKNRLEGPTDEVKALQQLLESSILHVNEDRIKDLNILQMSRIKRLEIELKEESKIMTKFFNDNCTKSLDVLKISRERAKKGQFCDISFYFKNLKKWVQNTKVYVELSHLQITSSELGALIKFGPKGGLLSI